MAKRKFASYNSYIGLDGVLDNFPSDILFGQVGELVKMYEELDIHFRMFLK